MGDSDRTALLDLFAEQRDHASVTFQYVSKTYRHIFGLGAVVKYLDHHLAHPLGRPHDIRRIDRFVRRDQHEFARLITVCCQSNFISPEHIIFDRLIRTASINGTCLCAAA